MTNMIHLHTFYASIDRTDPRGSERLQKQILKLTTNRPVGLEYENLRIDLSQSILRVSAIDFFLLASSHHALSVTQMAGTRENEVYGVKKAKNFDFWWFWTHF